MKKHNDVQEILRRNGISGSANLENVTVIGGYYETFVMWQSGGTSYIGNADSNTPDSVTIVTGNTTITVAASGESYFMISGATSVSVNTIPIIKTSADTTFSGTSISVGETIDALDGKYYTLLGDVIFGQTWRILNLGTSGASDVTISSVSITAPTGVTSGTTQQMIAVGTYSNGSTTVLTDDVVWSTSDLDIATISTTGLLSMLVADVATITATYDDPLGSGQVIGTVSVTGTTY